MKKTGMLAIVLLAATVLTGCGSAASPAVPGPYSAAESGAVASVSDIPASGAAAVEQPEGKKMIFFREMLEGGRSEPFTDEELQQGAQVFEQEEGVINVTVTAEGNMVLLVTEAYYDEYAPAIMQGAKVRIDDYIAFAMTEDDVEITYKEDLSEFTVKMEMSESRFKDLKEMGWEPPDWKDLGLLATFYHGIVAPDNLRSTFYYLDTVTEELFAVYVYPDSLQ